MKLTNALLDDPEMLKGAPVALQLVGRKWKDAQLLSDVECIQKALHCSEESVQ